MYARTYVRTYVHMYVCPHTHTVLFTNSNTQHNRKSAPGGVIHKVYVISSKIYNSITPVEIDVGEFLLIVFFKPSKSTLKLSIKIYI